MRGRFVSLVAVAMVVLTMSLPLLCVSSSNGLTVSIESPKKGSFYFNDEKIFSLPLDLIVIVGKITVKISCSQDVEKVKFIVDGTTMYIDYERPFEWVWDSTVYGFHSLEVKAFDRECNEAVDEVKVLIFNYEREGKWPLTDSNIYITDIPTVRDLIPIGTVHMETSDHILKNLPDPKWGLQCFIFVGWGFTEDKKHYITFQGRVPIVGWMAHRFCLDGNWYILPPTKAPMYLDDEKRMFKYPTVYTEGDTFTWISYDETNRTWIFGIDVPSRDVHVKIVGKAQGIPFWMGKPEGPYIIHGVSCTKRDFDVWGGFWDVGYCDIYLTTPSMNATFHGNFLFDRAYHRTYFTKGGLNRGALAYFSCMYIHGESDIKFDLMLSHSLNPSPLKNPAPMQHQARINFLDENKSYPFEEFSLRDDGNLQPSKFYLDGKFKDGEIHLNGTAVGYWPPEWGISKGLWWDKNGEHTWGRAFVVWNGTITLNGRTIAVKNAIGLGEFTRYKES